MDDSHSDALVFFGATGDLAYKQIFPALQALVKRHNLDIPIVGGACSFGLERKSASAKLFAPWFGIYYCPSENSKWKFRRNRSKGVHK
jgi:Glucose-6-phosphate dehydrogenase, NAD binding domain